MKWFFIPLFFFPLSTTELFKDYFIIWNVGQGSWASLIHSHDCLHFDMGGERYPQNIDSLCASKSNTLFLSHDDRDHIRFAGKLLSWKQGCLAHTPRKIFKKLINRFPICNNPSQEVTELKWQVRGQKSNDQSRVYILNKLGVLIPGDSPRSEEKIWAQQVKGRKIKWWLLGHHGSLTSNSKILIQNLDSPIAISSARWAPYRHPHPLVEARLRQNKIPLLKTSDWGNLWIEIP